MVHHVFKLRGEENTAYLKIRGRRFANLDIDYPLDPKDILFEKKALKAFHRVAPDVFPEVLAFDIDRAAILMTDVNPSEKTFVDRFANNEVNVDIVTQIGRTLGRVHTAVGEIPNPMGRKKTTREYNEAKYNQILDEKVTRNFGYQVLEDTAEALRAQPKQLIIGDAAPKNIGLKESNTVSIYDLDAAHMGNTDFDVGYLLGHIILHSADNDKNLEEFPRAFISGYLEEHGITDMKVVRNVALATILYRLDSDIPYNKNLDQQRSDLLLARVKASLQPDVVVDVPLVFA
jgi:5-methylthioribose kinase